MRPVFFLPGRLNLIRICPGVGVINIVIHHHDRGYHDVLCLLLILQHPLLFTLFQL